MGGGGHLNKWQSTSLQVFVGTILCKSNKSNTFEETSKILLNMEGSLHPNQLPLLAALSIYSIVLSIRESK